MDDVSRTTEFSRIHEAFVSSQPVLTEWTNNTSFYVMYPTYYQSFANLFLRKWLGWYDGYVQGIHNSNGGLLSTRIGTTIVRRLSQQVTGGGLLYEVTKDNVEGNKALDFISNEWASDTDFSNVVSQAIEFAGAGGTSAIKLNTSANKELWAESFRADSFYLNISPKGDVKKAKFLINKFTRTVPNTKESQNFYIVEERYYRENELGETRPYVEYNVYRTSGQVTSQDVSPKMSRGLTFSEIPADIVKVIKDEYGTLELRKPQLIPFRDLGVYALKWTKSISNLPQMQYGESLLATIQSYLFMYDYMYSSFNTDMYLGRGRVYVPKHLQNPNKPRGTNYNQGLDSFLFTKVDGTSNEYNKLIEAMQFDLRSSEWVTNRNNLLESMATAIGISPSTIASYLNDISARTAREISSEESSTTLFVEAKRELFKVVINKLLKTVLNYYGFQDEIKIRFSKAGQTNTTLLIENTTKKLNAGLISKYSAIKEVNPDFNEEQLDTEIKMIESDQREAQQQQQSDLFGSEFNDNQGDFVDEPNSFSGEDTDTDKASD